MRYLKKKLENLQNNHLFVIMAVKFIVTIENADKNILCDFGINKNELKIDNKEIIAKLLLIKVCSCH